METHRIGAILKNRMAVLHRHDDRDDDRQHYPNRIGPARESGQSEGDGSYGHAHFNKNVRGLKEVGEHIERKPIAA